MENPEQKNKHTDDLIDHYWGCIDNVTKLIRSSELKAGLILSFYGIILNFILQNVKSASEHLSDSIALYILFGLWFVSTFLSIYYSIRSFIPRIEVNYEKNIFFFKDIIKSYGNVKQFSQTFYEISKDEDRVFDQLGQQIFINSKIAAAKFKNVNTALLYLAIGFLLLFSIVVYSLVYMML